MSRTRLDELIERGEETLRRYVEWAAEVDGFEPLQVGGEFDAPVPDPADPRCDLPGPAGDRVRYRGRVDVLALDDDRRRWLVHHRLADRGWADVDDLLIEDVGATACWAWERCFSTWRSPAPSTTSCARCQSRASPPKPGRRPATRMTSR